MSEIRKLGYTGEIEEVVTGLSVPTGMIFGPSGAVYVSNLGAAPAGAGQILRFDMAPGVAGAVYRE